MAGTEEAAEVVRRHSVRKIVDVYLLSSTNRMNRFGAAAPLIMIFLVGRCRAQYLIVHVGAAEHAFFLLLYGGAAELAVYFFSPGVAERAISCF